MQGNEVIITSAAPLHYVSMSSSAQIRPVAVVGPTASGKTAISLELAKRLDGEVVNIDSMQLYRGMDIGTAKVPVEQRQGIPHHQLDIWPVTKPASVAEYRAGAIQTVEEIFSRGNTPIIVGGSMMYIQALVDEWDFPPTDPAVRDKWQRELDERGVAAMHQYLASIDPEAARIIEDNDPRRTVRALEVIELTGKPFAASQPPKNSTPRWNMRLLGLHAPAEWLNPRIELRVRQMFDRGLVEERCAAWSPRDWCASPPPGRQLAMPRYWITSRVSLRTRRPWSAPLLAPGAMLDGSVPGSAGISALFGLTPTHPTPSARQRKH